MQNFYFNLYYLFGLCIKMGGNDFNEKRRERYKFNNIEIVFGFDHFN